ncbi:uroporphyrinogen decarboxylase [Quadrisphaera granulorum]
MNHTGEPLTHTPVWFMRQAGRSLPEYRRVREGIAMLDACMTPDLVTEITLQPVRRYGVDGAVLYSDIVLPLKAAGVDLDIVPGTGPVVAKPVRTAADVDALPELHPDQLEPIAQAVRQLVGELDGLGGPGGVPLIGFAGAPFTLASYLVEGGPSKDHAATKAFIHTDPGLWRALAEKLARVSATFLQVQVENGARVVQLFDSWAGALSLADYREHAMPASASVLAAVGALRGPSTADGLPVPRIHFGVGTGELLGAMGEAGADVVGVDYRVSLRDAAARTRADGTPRALQGNLDPALLGAPPAVLDAAVDAVLEDAAAALGAPAAGGHVFNLGHGVPPGTDPDALLRVVERVHERTSR